MWWALIDVTNQLFNDIYTAVIAAYPNANILKTYQANSADFPCVTLREIGNTEIDRDLRNSGVRSQQSWQIDIYARGGTREIIAKKIRDIIASVTEGKYHMKREASLPTDNAIDTTIYRWTLRYSCKIDEDHNIIYQ